MRPGAALLMELIALCVDGVVWGVAACTAYRSLTGTRRAWLGAALVFGALFVVWDEWVFGELAHWAGFPRTYWQPSRLLEAGVQVAATLVGFRAGDLLLSSIPRRRRAGDSAEAARSDAQ